VGRCGGVKKEYGDSENAFMRHFDKKQEGVDWWKGRCWESILEPSWRQTELG